MRQFVQLINIQVPMPTFSSHEARQQFARLLEQAYYQDAKIRIKRNNQPMAWLVGEPFIQAVNHLIDHLLEHEPVLADTLAITLDGDICGVIEQSRAESKAGKLVPLQAILND